jgi:hypothetical protein
MFSIAIIQFAIVIGLFLIHSISYWVFIFPAVKKAAKTTFLKSFFIYGQNVADLNRSDTTRWGSRVMIAYWICKVAGFLFLIALVLLLFSAPYLLLDIAG